MCARNNDNDLSEVVQQPVANEDSGTDNDWDEYEVVDPKSGRKTEDQPFAQENDWNKYGAGDIPGTGSSPPEDCDAVTSWINSIRLQRPVVPHVVDNTSHCSTAVLVQEAVVLRRRGVCIQTIRHTDRGDLALLYTAESGRRYIIDPNSRSNRVFEDCGDRRIPMTVWVKYKHLRELLTVIDFNDLVSAPLTQEESHG